MDEVEPLKYSEVSYPLFADGANSFVIVLLSTSITEIR